MYTGKSSVVTISGYSAYKALRGNQANPAHSPKYAQFHFYRKGQQGEVFFSHTSGFRCETFQVFLKQKRLLLADPFCRN